MGSGNPWSRLDVFSGGFLLLSLGWVATTMRFMRAIVRSPEGMREALGTNYDPTLHKWVNVIAIAELTVFLDYGHWRLVPALERPALQGIGLGLYVLGAAWLFWVDTYLARHFVSELAASKVITDGPYNYVRHPRYTAVLASRVAFAFTLASVIAWLFALAWLLLILRRIRLEEGHLREIFSADYDAYARRTARLLPGVY